jgi:hypothetical protein
VRATDSIAGHGSGLAALAQVLGKVRRKTTEEPLTLPYRHGIHHGLDLAYDNRLVAAKAWAALFATGDWARAVQKARTVAPPATVPGWKDVIRQLRENAADTARLEAWRPRDVRPGRDLPVVGAPEEYPGGTPERRLVEFLTAWQARNFGHMAQCLSYRLERNINRLAGQLREHYENKDLRAFALLEVSDEAPAITIIKARLICGEGGRERDLVTAFRLICEDTMGQAAARGKPAAAWAVLTGQV